MEKRSLRRNKVANNVLEIVLFEENLGQKKISLDFEYITDVSDINKEYVSKIFVIKDCTNSKRIISIGFDLDGRILNINLKSAASNSCINILERSFDGKFYVYENNCENLKIENTEVYAYYDYYNEKICENLKLSRFLINSVQQFVGGIVLHIDNRNNEFMMCIGDLDGNAVNIILEKILSKSGGKQHLADSAQMRKIYPTPVTVLPPEVRPDRSPNFCIVQITQGCRLKESRGACHFCDSYDNICYKERSDEEIRMHIDRLIKYLGDGWEQVSRIFLSDADPLFTKKSSSDYFKILTKKVPNIGWYESFISTVAILSKSEEEWLELMRMGLKKVYWGVESANDEVLALLGKAHNNELLNRAARILNKIELDFIVILMSGVGNLDNKSGHSDSRHIVDSVDFIKRSNCKNVYISRFIAQENTKIYSLISKGELFAPSIENREMEHRSLVKKISQLESSHIKKIKVKGTYGVQFNQ